MDNKLIKAGLTGNVSYEFFMLAISLLSYINLILIFWMAPSQELQIILVIDKFIALLFFIDFIRRLISSKDKSRYFFRQYGWADLLASIPLSFFNIFRAFRIFRFIKFMRNEGHKNVLSMVYTQLANTSLYIIFFLVILLLEFGSIAMLLAEQNAAKAVILNASDALWFVVVSITTVGYGDMYPVTDAGRYIGTLVLVIGVGLYAVVTGYIVDKYLSRRLK